MRILFVCLGNICRSPTAEVVFRDAARNAGLAGVRCASAGIGDWHVGSPPDPRSIRHAAKRGYDLRPLRARQLVAEDFARFERIYAMDGAVLEAIDTMKPGGYAGLLALFLDAAPHLGVCDVPDPYQQGPEGFERVLDLVEHGCAALVSELSSCRRDSDHNGDKASG
jgi:protein-tyrosine phosphatase